MANCVSSRAIIIKTNRIHPTATLVEVRHRWLGYISVYVYVIEELMKALYAKAKSIRCPLPASVVGSILPIV